MAIYCIDDGGDGSQTNTTQSATTLDWSKADASIADLISYDAAAFTTADNIIYFGDDTNDPDKAAAWTLTGPTTGRCKLVSADRTNATPTYKKGTGDQLSSLGGAYTSLIINALDLYGIKVASGSNINFGGSNNDFPNTYNCTVAPAAGAYISSNSSASNIIHTNLVVDLTADGTTARASSLLRYGGGGGRITNYKNLSFINAGYRTADVFGGEACSFLSVSESDFSGFTNATACEIVAVQPVVGHFILSNCLTAETWTPVTGTFGFPHATVMFTNCGPSDKPSSLYYYAGSGASVSSTAVYRTGGATVESEATSWLITTTADCAEGAPFCTPWIYDVCSSTGSKTFDIYITNDTADFTNAEVWPELEYLKDADEATWTPASGQRATITTTAAAQADDTTSTWTEISGSGTYSQTSTTVTVTDTAHGLIIGSAIAVDVTGTGGVTDGTYTVTSVAAADTFTFTASTGNGSGTLTWQMAPLYTYKQKLSVTAVIGETGQYRMRIAVGVASIAGSRYFYVCPKVNIS